jgi:hypothetical protein
MTERVSPEATPAAAEPTIGRLVADASRDISALVQSEIALAKSELKVSAKTGGLAVAMFLAAGFLGLLVIVLASITIAYFLIMTGLDPAWAFLIVTGVYLLIAVALVVIGYFRIKKVRAPTRTIATAKQIPAALKGQR